MSVAMSRSVCLACNGGDFWACRRTLWALFSYPEIAILRACDLRKEGICTAWDVTSETGAGSRGASTTEDGNGLGT